MRQLWPLNRASLEIGPHLPFDNGPNGVNTLVGPQWLTRYSFRCAEISGPLLHRLACS